NFFESISSLSLLGFLPQCVQAGHYFFSGDRMLADAHATSVVDRVCQCCRNRSDGCFRETLGSKKPARLQAVDEHVNLLIWNVHDGRKSVREVADAMVAETWKFTIPRNGFGR